MISDVSGNLISFLPSHAAASRVLAANIETLELIIYILYANELIW